MINALFNILDNLDNYLIIYEWLWIIFKTSIF